MGISRAEALDSVRSDDLLGIGMEADAVRRRLHPEGVVSYAVTCRVDCSSGDVGKIRADAQDSLAVGGSGVVLTGTAKLGLDEIVSIVRELRGTAPETWISGLNAADLSRLAPTAGELEVVLARLIEAGWNSPASDAPDLMGDGSEVEQWFGVQRAAHRAGLRTVAAMRFGAGESGEQKVDFLERTAALQGDTGGFAAFAPENAAGGLQGPTAVECLKTVAVARLMLDSIPSVEAGRATYSLKVLETMLRFGADDAGEVFVQRATTPDLREEDLRRVIRDAGFTPVERDPGYRLMFVG
jgi:cyclic dehypoxanthinyl futalosine synthase